MLKKTFCFKGDTLKSTGCGFLYDLGRRRGQNDTGGGFVSEQIYIVFF